MQDTNYDKLIYIVIKFINISARVHEIKHVLLKQYNEGPNFKIQKVSSRSHAYFTVFILKKVIFLILPSNLHLTML